jgi:heme exporter protein C
MKLPRWFHQLGSPPYVYRLAERLCPWLGGIGITLLAVGAFWGLVIAPPDYQQGDSARIIYIHPQTAYIGMMAYVVMAIAAAIGYVWRLKLAHAVAVSAAPIGAWFTFFALVKGAVLGRPTCGT